MSDFLNNFIEEFDAKTSTKKQKIPDAPVLKEEVLKISFRNKTVTEEILVPRFKKNINLVLNKSIILYGPSESGKTYILRDLMHLTKTCFPIVFAFVPTNTEKHDYDSLIPKPLVFEHFGLKEIREIYERQRMTTEIYNNANNLKTLHSLFDRVSNEESKQFLKELLHLRRKAIMSAEKKTDKKKIEEIEEIFKTKLTRFYKTMINKSASALQRMDLSQDEKIALRYINLNPRMLILFDDALVEVM